MNKRYIYIALTSLLIPYIVGLLIMLQGNFFLWPEKAKWLYFVAVFLTAMALLAANIGNIKREGE